ncbi:prp-17, partial [Pristionchus pacificus]|uniref:Pre-mRNA-processing factor 17 n=1 Tax=Pristionchus pacificus TaxID=54126 RepID=A0A2A6BK60_PRIPA
EMDLLRGYTAHDSDSDDNDHALAPPTGTSLGLAIQAAPFVVPDAKKTYVAVVNPDTKQLDHNPRYDELFLPEAGPSNPFKTERQKAAKNTLTGFVEPAHINQFHFDREIRSFDTLGYARNPTAENGDSFIGDKQKAQDNKGGSLFDSTKTGGEKRKRARNDDAGDVEGYEGPWAKYKDEKTVAIPDPELQKEMDAITEKRKKKSRKYKKEQEQEKHSAEEKSTFHLKEALDYQGRSFMAVPSFTGVNLREDAVPDRCFIPKKLVHTYKGHSKGINAMRLFPKSGHLLLTASMDSKIKLWEVYNNHSIIRTYEGHKLPIKDIAFNYHGTEFASASYDKYIKLWDTETGQVKQRFHTGHIPNCVKFHPDEDKTFMLCAGMSNKKIVQWDSRSGDVVQEYDRHLGGVNSITFFDKNRRFCTTAEDKSLRIWEWEIPVDTKLIQNAGMHSVPTMTKSPTDKWIVGQSMDNRIVLFQLIEDKLRFAKKKAFRGHNSAGYACAVDFSPDMSFLTSGDADGKVFIWDWRTHKIVARWKAHEQTCISVLWHPHEKSKLISASWDGTMKMMSSLVSAVRRLSTSLPACAAARQSPVRGRFRAWSKPVYVSPEPKAFALEPDFSFLDGRPCPVTSQFQLDWKKDQLRLAKSIVSSLAEIREMERVHESAIRSEEEARQTRERSRPIPKGTKTIQ